MEKLENDILIKRLNAISKQLEEKNIFLERNISDPSKKQSFCFVIYTLQRFLDNYSIDELMEYITEGSGDHDIDIFHIDEDDGVARFNIFQVKFKHENNLKKPFGEKEVESFLSKIKKILIENDENISPPNKFLQQKIAKFYDLINISEKQFINIYLVTNGQDLNDQERKTLDRFKQKNSIINECKSLCDYGFFIDNEDGNIGEINIPITGDDFLDMSGEIQSKIVNISAYQIAKLFEKFQDRILEKNVRKLLKGKTNQDIEESLLNNPKFFWYKNNGLSIVCKRMEIKTIGGKKSLVLENPYIVNGGQTTKTIFNLFKKRDENNDDEMKPFYESNIMARIYQTTDENVINQIVYGTNNQNKILASDLKSLNPNIKKIKIFFAEHDISLITKRDSEEKVKNNSISSDLLLQIYWAIYGDEPHRSKISKTTLINDKFDEVFNNENTHKNLITSFRIYKFVYNKVKELTNGDIINHGLFSILYTIVLVSPKLKTAYDETLIIDAYIKGIRILESVISQQRKLNKDFSPHNFFKSKKSTIEIQEYVKSNLTDSLELPFINSSIA